MEEREGEIIQAKLDSHQSESQISHLALDIGGDFHILRIILF